jgi:AcrR family transcriptional regulator
MGRRSIANIEKKILEEVLRENFKYGITSISTKDLARRLHISEPVIFAHFQTKQHLIDSAFEYAWKKVPVRAIFPSVGENIDDPSVFKTYLSRFHEILSEPKALVYGENYFHSSYYNADLDKQVEAPLVDKILATVNGYPTSRDEEHQRLLVMRYLANLISVLSQFASGAIPQSDDNFRLAYGMVLFGAYGLVRDYPNI